MGAEEDTCARFLMRRPMLRDKWIRAYLKGNKTVYITYAATADSEHWPTLTTASICDDRYWAAKDTYPNSEKERVNAILINVRKDTYMYVGQEIYSLETDDVISEFISEEGSARTPFSVGLGQNYVYFFTERMKIPRPLFHEFARTVSSTLLNKCGYRRFDNLVGKKATVVYRMLYELYRSAPNDVKCIKVLSTML